ncbi:MAG: hypothetical protein ACYC91_10090 [Solirubrobacteraceae bacterium]
MSRRKKAMAVPFSAADVAGIAKANPYIQRVVEDPDLRENFRKAVDSTKSAYDRISSSKAPAKALIDDKKLQAELRDALEAIRDVTTALTDAPKRTAKKRMGLGRKLLIAGAGGGVALAANQGLRSKVLDMLFGAEEEFQYTPPAAPAPAPPANPVSAA